MLPYLKRALQSPTLAESPSDAEIAAWLSKSPALPQDVSAAFSEQGTSFLGLPPPPISAATERKLVAAMNRANPDDKLSRKTLAELDRLRRLKTGG